MNGLINYTEYITLFKVQGMKVLYKHETFIFLILTQAPDTYTISQTERGDAEMITESVLQFALEPALLWKGALFVRCQAVLKLVHDLRSLELIVGEGTSGAQFQRSELFLKTW